MGIVNSEFHFPLNFANQYALLWAPNAYHHMQSTRKSQDRRFLLVNFESGW